MTCRADAVWKSQKLTATYLEGVRGAIPLAQQQLDVVQRLLSACGIPVRRFLDLGCGDGVLAAAVLEVCPSAHAVVVDFSEPMLEAARQRFAGAGAAVQFVNADYGVPSWSQAISAATPFDVIVSGYSIHHQPDSRKLELYAELFALLEPGGVFVNVEHVQSASPWIAGVHDELFIDHMHLFQAGKSRSEIAEAYHARPDKDANILTPVEMQCQWLREIGFTDVDCYLKIFELAVFGGRRPRWCHNIMNV